MENALSKHSSFAGTTMARKSTIQPKQVMIYAIDRATPVKTLEKIPLEELKSIAARGKKLGFDMTVSA